MAATIGGVEREAARGNDAVNVRVQGQGLPPGVQDGKRTDACTEEFGVTGDDEQRVFDRGEKDVVEPTRSGKGERVERLGNGEYDVEVWHREDLALSFLEPLPASLGLTTGTVPVPTRVPDHVAKATAGAFIEMPAHGLGTTE